MSCHVCLTLKWASYLDEIGGVSVIINAARVKTCPSALGAQTGNQAECCNGRGAIGRWCRERYREHAHKALYGKDLSRRKAI